MNKYKLFVGCITLICCCFNERAAELHLKTIDLICFITIMKCCRCSRRTRLNRIAKPGRVNTNPVKRSIHDVICAGHVTRHWTLWIRYPVLAHFSQGIFANLAKKPRLMDYAVQELSWQNELQRSCFQNIWQTYALLISLYREIRLFVASVLQCHLAFRLASTFFRSKYHFSEQRHKV